MSPWRTVALGNIAESVDYGVTASAKKQPPGPKFLRITDIQNGMVQWANVPWCDCDAQVTADARLRAGDIVFARTGATTGKSFLIRECPADAVFASYLIRVRFPAAVEPRFVIHYFQTPEYWAQITRGTRGVAQPGVNATTLKSLSVPLPPLSEQRRIAALLDKADELRMKRRAALEQMSHLAQAIFDDMFGDPANNPKGWQVMAVADLCSVKGGKRLPKGEDYSSTPTKFPYIRVTDLHDGRVDETNLVHLKPEVQATIARYVVNEGDVIISIAGSIGQVAPVTKSLDGVNLTENAAKLTPLKRNSFNAVYLSQLLRSKSCQAQIRSNIGQVTIGKLALFRIETIRLMLPPLSMQNAFEQRVEAATLVRRKEQTWAAEMDRLFAALQHQAFSGAI